MRGNHANGQPLINPLNQTDWIAKPAYSNFNSKESKMSRKQDPNKYFDGKICKKCGGTKRYISNKQCVNCLLDKMYHTISKRSKKRKDLYNNKMFYKGEECKNCGNNIRYVSNQGCVECVKKRAREKK